MAQEASATLIAISLLAPEPGKRIRLEDIEESKDFLEVIHHHARMYQVIAERHEVWVATGDNISARIQTLVRDYQCDSIVVIVKQGQGVLLQTDVIADLMLNPPASLVLLRLPGKQKQNRIRKGANLFPVDGHPFPSFLARTLSLTARKR
jgi:hypothetical protein